MTVIFKNIDIKKFLNRDLYISVLNRVLEFVIASKIIVRAVCLVLVVSCILTLSVVAARITFALNVNYLGRNIATVQSVEVFNIAKKMAVKDVNSEGADSKISTPKFTLTMAVADNLDDSRKVADAIIENTSEIISASALIINGEQIGCADTNELSNIVETRKNAFIIEGAQNIVEFVDDVQIKTGLFLESDLKDIESLKETVNSLQVKTVSTLVHDVEIAYGTRKIKTDTQVSGYYKVTTKGQNGISRQKEIIETINGEQISREVLSSQVVLEPVSQVITIGTASPRISATEKANISSAGFICPITKGRFVISSYWGDGRNHKGIDLAANSGVAIFAAANGTVTYSGYDGDYGYSVVIDHGNGIKTRYAHARALCVSKGQTVSQGDMIAAVGSTGYSTGNHLHFEVIINGARVNPAPYIGL